MLRELPNARQMTGEPKRRWFFCHETDLVVFEDEEGICGFQLASEVPAGIASFVERKLREFNGPLPP